MCNGVFQMYADYNCNSDKLPAELPIFSWMVGHAAWTLTRYAPKAVFKLMRSRIGLVSYYYQAAKAGGTVERSSLGWKVGTI